MRNLIFLLISLTLFSNCFTQVLTSGNYVITLADGGKALDAAAESMGLDDGLIQLWENNGGSTQVWTIRPVSGNSYSIILKATGMALDADGPGMYTDGGKVHLWTKREDGFKTQTWTISFAGNNSYTVVLKDGGKALDAGISSMYQNGGMVHLWSKNSNKTQKWVFTKAVPITDGQTVISSLTTLSPQDNALWEKANTDQLGIIGNDFRGGEPIGTASFEREFHFTTAQKIEIGLSTGLIGLVASGELDNLNFWVPQHREQTLFKRTLSGTIADKLPTDDEANPHVAKLDGVLPDHDLNIDIEPSANYRYLLTDVKAREYTPMMKWQNRFHFIAGGQANCDSPSDLADFTKRVEAEISVDENMSSQSNQKMIAMLSQQPHLPICVYGPWIYDKGHCCHPEIHPAEEVWWRKDDRDTKIYQCNVFCDASERFWWRDQMDDGTKLKPWGAPPTKGLFAIAFETTISDLAFQPEKKFEAGYIDHYNLTENASANKTYSLVYQGKTLASFVPNNGAFKVSFEKIGLKPGTNNIIRGFLVLETSVGLSTQVTTRITVPGPSGTSVTVNIPAGIDPQQIDQKYERQVFKKEKGHYMFSITETTSGVGVYK